MAFIVPFNYNPESFLGNDNALTPASGKYALIYPLMRSTADLTVDGNVVYDAHHYQEDQTITSSSNTPSFTLPNYGFWKCRLYKQSASGASNEQLTLAVIRGNTEFGDGIDLTLDTDAFNSAIFEANDNDKIEIQAGGFSGTNVVYRLRATRIDAPAYAPFWVPSGAVVAGSFSYSLYNVT